MVGCHHRLNGREFAQTLGDSKGQGNLACCSHWGCKDLDMTERLNSNMCIHIYMDFPGGSSGKESVCSAGFAGSVLRLGRSPGGENGNQLQYSCLGNPKDRGA